MIYTKEYRAGFFEGFNAAIEKAAQAMEREFNLPNTSKYYGEVVRKLKLPAAP